jgi:hypothetical protein
MEGIESGEWGRAWPRVVQLLGRGALLSRLQPRPHPHTRPPHPRAHARSSPSHLPTHCQVIKSEQSVWLDALV